MLFANCKTSKINTLQRLPLNIFSSKQDVLNVLENAGKFFSIQIMHIYYNIAKYINMHKTQY